MSRSRSASVSGASPFAPPATSSDLSASADMLSALSLEGRDVKSAISRGGTPSVWRTASGQTATTIVQQATGTVELKFKEAVVPQVLDIRPPCRVRRPGAPRFRSSPGSTAFSSAQGRGGGGSPPVKGDALNSGSMRVSTLSPLSIRGARGGDAEQGAGSPQHPLDEPRFAGGLMAAGYLEMFDISRRKIKTRFSHGLGKEKLKEHLATFLDEKKLKSRGEYMIRFVGQQDVHSPFVHIYTTTLLLDTSTLKTIPPSLSVSDTLTTWTHLRTIGNASHWSAKKPKFWPLRVVLEGPSSTDIVPSADEPPSPVQRSRSNRQSRREDEDLLSPATEQNTKANSAFVNHPKREVIEPSSPPRPRLTLPIPPTSMTPASTLNSVPMTPTILASVKQLGVAVANSIPPNVQTAVQSQVAALRNWMGKRGEDEEDEDEDEEERSERRRARRHARREREREERRIPSRREREKQRSRSRERDTIEERQDKETRREEKDRRREERRRVRG